MNNRCDWGAGFDGGGTGNARDQRLVEFLRVAHVRVGLDKRFRFHAQIIAGGEANSDTPSGCDGRVIGAGRGAIGLVCNVAVRRADVMCTSV